MINELSFNDIRYYLIVHLFLILIKECAKYLIINYFEKYQINSKSEEENLEYKINSLKKEAELHNTPSDFVKYTKITRQISKLENDLFKLNEDKKLLELKNKSTRNNNNSLIFSNKYLSIKIELLFWLIAIIEYFYIRKYYLIIDAKKYENNIINLLYLNKERAQIEIPLSRILIIEYFFIYDIKNIILKSK